MVPTGHRANAKATAHDTMMQQHTAPLHRMQNLTHGVSFPELKSGRLSGSDSSSLSELMRFIANSSF